MRSHIVRLLSGLALAAVLIYLVVRKVDWEPFLEGLATCRWTWILASMGCGLLALILRGLRWRRLLLPIDGNSTRLQSITACCIGNLCNNALPTSGEWVRSVIVSRDKSRFDRVLGSVAAERIVDLLTLGFILASLSIFGWNFIGRFVMSSIIEPVLHYWERPTAWLGVMLVILLSALFAALIWLVGRKFRSQVKDVLTGIKQGMMTILHMPDKIFFGLDTAAIWALYGLQVMGVSLALDLGMLPKDAMLLSALGGIASVIPVPGGIGAYHYIIALCLSSLYGMSWSDGLLFATLCHESQLLTAIFSALVSWLILPGNKGSMLR